MKYARVIDNIAQEVITFDPVERFHPEVVPLFVSVPDEVNQGSTLIDGVWTPYVEPVPVVIETIKLISADTVRKTLSLAERTKWDNASTPEIVTAKVEFSQPLSLSDATEVLDFLVERGSLSKESVEKIKGL